LSSYRRRGPLTDLGAQLGLPPGVTLLVILNLVAFLAVFLIDRALGDGREPLFRALAFDTRLAFSGQVWRFVTYMFLHSTSSIWHIVLNMFMLWMFGPRIEEVWGQRTFLIYYFVCGIGGALTYGAFALVGLQADAYMVGASGAIFGLLLAFGVTYPDAVILIFFIIPMRAKYAVMIFGLIELVSVPRAGNVAHLAHLGGMLFGYLFLLWATGGRVGRIPRVPRLGGGSRPRAAGYDRSARGGGGLGTWIRSWRTRMRIKVVDGQRSRSSTVKTPAGGNGGLSREDREQVDRILEKISREGLQSLTAEEQEVLRRASRKD